MRIVVDIERLVLEGLGARPGEAARIRQALERELVKTLRAWPAGQCRGGAVPSLTASAIRLTAPERAETTGARIGRAVGQAVLGGRGPASPSGKPGHG